ncbi:serine/threonine-protein kinase [Luteimonas mephitis]|uniref:serine/threonine-protein kinase n=1 Tax=Luteimonas mephitis TaxID=83615 RepID=UPI00047DA419|nr:serine/threonine-protein kinase [Luteimonas mephitis]
MDPETLSHWQAADAAFDHWLDLPENERDAWLAAQELAEPVRRHLDQLIAAHRQPRASLDPFGGNLIGHQFGGWTLDAELGRGGMAVVYRGWREQGMARQQAAIKILTLGALGAVGRDRFKREAAILARLNHPNITALVDSGVADDGTCWLAMPLVEGERIDHWCEREALDTRAVVGLCLQVCDAVAHAHRSLVIHRDLKPSNVLVEAGGHVRLLDFGIGQFTDSTEERTHTLWRALTPGYAAPEQRLGAASSTAMDVYGIGALLHKLLSGKAPRESEPGEATTPTRPSLLVRDIGDLHHHHHAALKSDLDRVLQKALAPEPARRYSSAEALADDLRRWLGGQPVLAQKPKLGYRLRKFVGRNKLGVAAAVLLVATLAGGIGATLWQADAARREADNARVQAQRAILVRDFLQQVFASTQPSANDVPSALDLLDEGSRRARSPALANDALAAADILTLTGGARMKLSRFGQAEDDLRTALELLERRGPGSIAERMRAHQELAEVFWNTGRQELGVEHARKAVALSETDGVPQRNRLDARLALAMATTYLDPAAAETMSRELLDDAIAAGFGDTHLHRDILDGLASALIYAGRDRAGTMPVLDESLRLTRLLDGEMSGAYAYALADASGTFLLAGKAERAGEMLEQAARIAESVYDQPHQAAAVIQCQLAAHLHLRGGQREQALRHYDAGADIDRTIGRKNLHAAECARYRGILRASLGQYAGALEDLDRSQSLRALNSQLRTAVTRSICGLRASIHLRQGDALRAQHALDRCPASAKAGDSIYFSLAQAEVLIARGMTDEAAALAGTLRRATGNRGPDNNWMRPWMLSMLLARRAGDTTAEAELASEAADFAHLPPAAACFTNPTKANCLALP